VKVIQNGVEKTLVALPIKPDELYLKLKKLGHTVSLANMMMGSSVACRGCDSVFLVETKLNKIYVLTSRYTIRKWPGQTKTYDPNYAGRWILQQTCTNMADFYGQQQKLEVMR
jgi:hypothetical protein